MKQSVKEGTFREDLYFRLFSVEIHIPPLRERVEDIIPIALMFVSKISRRFKRKIAGFDKETLKLFEQFPWPGNVRQLIHEIERLIALTPEGELLSIDNCSAQIQDFRDGKADSHLEAFNPSVDASIDISSGLKNYLENTEKIFIKKVLENCGNNKTKTAEALGISRQALYKKMKQFALGHNA